MKLFIWSLSAVLLTTPAFQSSASNRADPSGAASRFLARDEPPLTSAIALRHLTATTRGGSMTGWIDACTVLENGELRYWIVAEGGSGVVRRRALVAALEGEIKARTDRNLRAALDRTNYEFAPEIAEDGLLRVGLTPKRKDTMLIEGAMFLSPEDADLVRIEGRLVKPPSFWTRQVTVVRRYGRSGGVRVPLSMESTAKVLIVGTSTFAMTYRYLSINGESLPQDPGTPPEARICGARGSLPAVEPAQGGIADAVLTSLDVSRKLIVEISITGDGDGEIVPIRRASQRPFQAFGLTRVQ